jgi:capsular polysaccharide export protein
LLRIPPFPGAKVRDFVPLSGEPSDAADLADMLREHRVGGSYWAAQPALPQSYVLVRSASALGAAEAVADGSQLLVWANSNVPGVASVTGDCDPWHMLSGAVAVVVEADDEVRVIAALIGVPVHLFDRENNSTSIDRVDVSLLAARAVGAQAFANPFTGEAMSASDAIELCAYWRRLIHSNRAIGGGLGFAFWKQAHVAPLLWNGSGDFRFARNAGEVDGAMAVAVWRAKASPATLVELDQAGVALVEVEDGFLRSRGLGADCVPPLSITVDRLGAHFDPSRPSELEHLLEDGAFDEELLARAGELRRLIVEAGIAKYELGGASLERPAGDRRHILVPGQVEDDRAVQAGGCGLTSNLELLRRVREQAPDAFILYKPHPDVLAGHRRGAVPDRACLQYADTIVGNLPISSLIEMVDEVHVNTSLAGFEALLRGKAVTTYGVPFYAGWGLTRDLGPVPTRRTSKRSLDELVAATLLLYPRYLDPVTGLPCPAEVVVARLSTAERRDDGLLVGMRRLQGKLMRRLRSLVQ